MQDVLAANVLGWIDHRKGDPLTREVLRRCAPNAAEAANNKVIIEPTEPSTHAPPPHTRPELAGCQ
jgi:hypothetical protein